MKGVLVPMTYYTRLYNPCINEVPRSRGAVYNSEPRLHTSKTIRSSVY